MQHHILQNKTSFGCDFQRIKFRTNKPTFTCCCVRRHTSDGRFASAFPFNKKNDFFFIFHIMVVFNDVLLTWVLRSLTFRSSKSINKFVEVEQQSLRQTHSFSTKAHILRIQIQLDEPKSNAKWFTSICFCNYSFGCEFS